VISLEGWVDIMYYVQDGHSFWDWIYFVLLIVVSIQMIQLVAFIEIIYRFFCLDDIIVLMIYCLPIYT